MNSLNSAPTWALIGIICSTLAVLLGEIAMWVAFAYGSLPDWLEKVWAIAHFVIIIVWGILSWRAIL